METKNIKVDYQYYIMKARSGKFINVQVLPNCSAGLDSDNAVVLSDMSELFGITENTQKKVSPEAFTL